MSKITDFIKRFFDRFTRKKALSENIDTDYSRLQYRYNDVIEYMEQSGGLQVFFQELAKIVQDRDKYYPSKVHGIDHTSRVTLFATMIATLDGLSEHDKGLLFTAARYHDVGRRDDRENKEHGAWSVEKSDGLDLLKEYSGEDRKIIEFAIEQHSLSREENEKALKKIPFWKRENYKMILSYLKDADALDRVRIANKSMQLDPERLRSQTAKQMVNLAYDNYREFGQIIARYNLNLVLEQSDDFRNAYPFINSCFMDKEWIFQNVTMIEDFQRRGIWENCIKSEMSAIDIIEDDKLLYAATQVKKGDFEQIRASKYKITYTQFLEIVSAYPEGVLDKLRDDNKLTDIFSLETFKKYGKKDSFEDRLSPDYLTDEQLLGKINDGADVQLMQSVFEQDYMVYKNLYTNHRGAFELLVSQKSLDIDNMLIAGILEVIDISHLEKLRQKGYNFRLVDLIYLASEFTPEQYLKIMNSDDVTQLFCYNDKIRKEEFQETFEELKKRKVHISEDILRENYKLYKKLLDSSCNIFSLREVNSYHIGDVYASYMKIDDAIFRAQQKNVSVKLTPETFLKVLTFSNQLNGLDEDEQEEFIVKIASEDVANDPRFIEYLTKKNRVFKIEKFEDLENYNAFCINKILESTQISLKESKRYLLNSLFNIEYTSFGNQDEVLSNLVDELYYYQKYKTSGELKIGDYPIEQMIDTIVQEIIDVMDSQTIDEFKQKLSTMSVRNTLVNLDSLMSVIKERMTEFSKEDIVTELNKTKTMIDGMDSYFIEYDGERIPVKVLDGEDFSISGTTVMPHCSAISKKLGYDRDEIAKHILEYSLNKDNRCTFFINQDMFAHPQSVLPDLEVIYGYVPNSVDQVSITGNRDLSTVKRGNGDKKYRISKRGVTQNRKFSDIVYTTCEEHNEGVLNDVYPSYVICFDEVSEIAVQKYKMLKQFYETNGIDQKIEFLVINARDKYLPNIEQMLNDDFALVSREIDTTGTLSEETINNLFNSREQNLTLRTIQAINCTSYRDSLWNSANNCQKLDDLATVLEKVSNVIPKDSIKHVMVQVDFLLERSGRIKSYQSSRFYDHKYVDDMDINRFVKVKRVLEQRLMDDSDSRMPKNIHLENQPQELLKE